jgi:hypothetical protein
MRLSGDFHNRGNTAHGRFDEGGILDPQFDRL